MLNAKALDYVAYVVDDTQKIAISLDGPIFVSAGQRIEIYWQYRIPVQEVQLTTTPAVSCTVYYLGDDWVSAGQGTNVQVGQYTRGIKIEPADACTVTVGVYVQSPELVVNPDTVSTGELDQPLTVTVQSEIPGFTYGWFYGPAWYVAVEAKRFIPIAEAVREGYAFLGEELIEVPQDIAPALPYELPQNHYAYGPIRVMGDAMGIISTVPDTIQLATIELGLIPAIAGMNHFPVPISTAWIVSPSAGTFRVFLPAVRRVRTTGIWRDGILIANETTPACIVLDEELSKYQLVTITT